MKCVEQARSLKNTQLRLIKESLASAEAAGAAAEAEMLQRVLERAEELAERLENKQEDVECVRRQCIQEMELNMAMSDAGWEDGVNSSPGGSPPGSPGISPPGSPRAFSHSPTPWGLP